jgi:RNA polymerase sigma-70 factor (ECF subfamily)
MDPRLVVRARRGDQPAFEALTLASHPRFFRLAFGILCHPVLSEEAVQQAFIDIWRQLRRLRDPERFDAWCCRFVVDACRAEAARRPPAPTAEAGAVARPAQAMGPFGARIDPGQIGRGFEQLSLDDRAALVLRYQLGLSPEDAVFALGAPAAGAADRLESALTALRETLDAEVRAAPEANAPVAVAAEGIG